MDYNQKQKRVRQDIYNRRDKISIDEALDLLADLGWAPALLYDDNGGWYITDQGSQTVVYDSEDGSPVQPEVSLSFIVKTKDRSDSPGAALIKYIEEEVKP